jgi:hypothetical protein
MTNTGDDMIFQASFLPWSNALGFEPVVAPFGLLTGGAVTPTATPQEVSVAALTAMMPGIGSADASTGVLTISTASTALAVRGTEADPFRITSIIVNGSGAVAATEGLVGSAFSETRGAAGGPPLIPVDAIEIAQVRLQSDDAGVVLASEIFTVPGIHRELASYPVYTMDFGRGQVHFSEALPAIHVGPTTKRVSVRGATPLFSPLPKAYDWVPAESTYSIDSTDTYDGPIGSANSSLGQASFSIMLEDGITDGFLSMKGKTIWVEFRPDRDRMTPRQVTQGVLGVSRTNPASGSPTASCTITPSVESLDIKE